MDAAKYKVARKTLLLPIVGILAFVIYLYIFNVDIPSILSTVQRINLPVYIVATFLILCETLVFSLSWRFLLGFLSVKLSLVKYYLYVWYGVFVDIIIPAESLSSEIVKVYLVVRDQAATEQKETTGKVAATLVIQRLMGMGLNIAGLVVGIAILWTEKQVSGLVFNLALLLVFLTTLFLILLVFLCIRESWTLKVIDALIRLASYISRGRWKLDKLRGEALRAATIFHDSIKQFGHAPRTVLASFVFYTLSWFINLCIVFLVFLSIGYPIQWGAIILTGSIVTAVKSIPLGIPFEVGLPEITMTFLYNFLGVPSEIAATSTILTRILTLWLKFFIGFGAQQWLEFKAMKVKS